MKRIALAICFLFVGMGVALAEVVIPTHSWDLGTEISHIKYEEPGVMKEKGMMYGIVGSYTYRNRLMLRADGKWSWGEVDYENSGTMEDIDDYIMEIRGLIGWDYPILEATILTPYIGFGYRYLNDDFAGTTSTGAQGYEREANYYYSPIGIETITALENGWSLGLNLEYDLFCKGLQKSHLEDLTSDLGTAENKQEKGYGIRGSVKLQKETEGVDLIIEPYIKYWNIKKSNETPLTYLGEPYVLYEPKNNSTEIGCKLAIRF